MRVSSAPLMRDSRSSALDAYWPENGTGQDLHGLEPTVVLENDAEHALARNDRATVPTGEGRPFEPRQTVRVGEIE